MMRAALIERFDIGAPTRVNPLGATRPTRDHPDSQIPFASFRRSFVKVSRRPLHRLADSTTYQWHSACPPRGDWPERPIARGGSRCRTIAEASPGETDLARLPVDPGNDVSVARPDATQ